MKSLGDGIRRLREERDLPLRTVADYLDIDQAVLSKIERGQRKASREQVVKLADYFKVKENDLLIAWLSDKLVYEVEDEKFALKALKVAEQKMVYKRKLHSQKTTIRKIREYFLRDGRVDKVWLFGSFARNEHDYASDIDVMIEVPATSKFSLFDLSEIKYQLEQRLSTTVDVVMNEAVRPQVMQRIRPELKLIYER